MKPLPDQYVLAFPEDPRGTVFSLNLACQVSSLTWDASAEKWDATDCYGNLFECAGRPIEAYAKAHYFKSGETWINPAAISSVRLAKAGSELIITTGAGTTFTCVADAAAQRLQWLIRQADLTVASSRVLVNLRYVASFDPVSGRIILVAAAGYSLPDENMVAPDHRAYFLTRIKAAGWTTFRDGGYLNTKLRDGVYGPVAVSFSPVQG